MECKTALAENDGDFVKAEQVLKDRGLAIAQKREERITNQGRVFGCFSDDVASLLELRCETDFVSQNELFIRLGEACVQEVHEHRLSRQNEKIQTLVSDLALHVAAFGPQFVRPEEISAEYRAEYEDDYRSELADSGKPEKLWDRIVTGKWSKHLQSVCLSRQPNLRDEDISVEEAGASIDLADFAYVSIAPAICL